MNCAKAGIKCTAVPTYLVILKGILVCDTEDWVYMCPCLLHISVYSREAQFIQ